MNNRQSRIIGVMSEEKVEAIGKSLVPLELHFIKQLSKENLM